MVAGTGRALVVAVGAATEAGRALALAGRAAGPEGIQSRLEELTSRGLPVTLLGGAAVTALALLRRSPLRTAVASGVGVAVAAVPEGLPLMATVAQLGPVLRILCTTHVPEGGLWDNSAPNRAWPLPEDLAGR